MERIGGRGRRRCSSRYEQQARRCGWARVAGLDEAGRGSLFGPVVAAAVILDPRRPIRGLDDSKKLAPARREILAARIRERAVAWATAAVDATRIDAWNILEASREAMCRALAALAVRPDFLLLDALELPVATAQRALLHGDARSVSIAAASILAKVTRDRMMVEADLRFPGYNLAQNKGYATPDHLAALARLGPTPQHRASFAPVRLALSWSSSATQQPLPMDVDAAPWGP